MKFKKLTIRNYRGVAEQSVEFADSGITLIQGPNEIGKTSLATSFNMLFNFKPRANTRETREIRPIHRDANPEIELEAESGAYRFLYRKTFHQRLGTAALTVLEPEPGNFTADAAHDRMQEILRETLDKELWDALMIKQGDSIEIPKLDGKTALMSALDAAASGGAPDRLSETLFEAVTGEYEKYYNKNGAESAQLIAAAADLAKARDRAATLAASLDALENAANRAQELKKRVADLTARKSETEKNRAGFQAQADEIATLENGVREERLRLQALTAAAQTAEAALAQRKQLSLTVTENAEALARHNAAIAETLAKAAAAEKTANSLAAELRLAEDEKRRAEAALTLARSDFDHLASLAHLEALQRRRQSVEAATDAGEAARRELAECAMTDSLLQKIREADLAVSRQEAKLNAAAPRVILRGLAAADLEVDDTSLHLAGGEERSFAAAPSLRLTVPGQLEVLVEAGNESEEIVAALTEARASLAELCREGGVANPEAAFAAVERRRLAEQNLQQLETTLRENLGGMERREFEKTVRDMEDAVARHRNRRPDGAALPVDAAEARERREQAAAAFERAGDSLPRLETAARKARDEYNALGAGLREARVEKEVAAKLLAQNTAAAVAAARQVADAELAARQTETAQAVREAENRVTERQLALAEKNPGKVTAMLQTLTGTLQSFQRRQAEDEGELAALLVELRIRGEEGLFDELQIARAEERRNEIRNARLRADAAAAALLFRVMKEKRENARRAYIVPLKEKIEELGRWVFNPSFGIEMDEESLGVRARSLDGVTVPFDSLSGGAREQLSLLFRAACSILVANREGMPLLLDDALGYTDTDRLQVMGAVLAKAAEQCQIIIFTCVPERYANIGDAKVVQL